MTANHDQPGSAPTAQRTATGEATPTAQRTATGEAPPTGLLAPAIQLAPGLAEEAARRDRLAVLREHLRRIISEAALARAAITAMHRASLRHAADDERKAYLAVQAHLRAVADAIDALPPELLREQRMPWAELSRLPALLARPDFLADARVLRRTLDRLLLRDLKDAAQRLISHLAYFLRSQEEGRRSR